LARTRQQRERIDEAFTIAMGSALRQRDTDKR
jgi:hypothetical protein